MWDRDRRSPGSPPHPSPARAPSGDALPEGRRDGLDRWSTAHGDLGLSRSCRPRASVRARECRSRSDAIACSPPSAKPELREQATFAHPFLLKQADLELDQPRIAQRVANDAVSPGVGLPAFDNLDDLLASGIR